MERFRQASEDNMYSERARVFQNLGMTALQLGQREEAELHFTRSLRLDSRQPRALLELALMAFEDKQYVPAKRSEEHTSELQSLMRISYAVFCLNKKTHNNRKQRNKEPRK